MATVEAPAEGSGQAAGHLPTPYNHQHFQKRLNQFHQLIRRLTLQDVEATPEERRQQITENLRFDQFSESIRALFGAEVHSNDLKTLYRKISTNPDAKVDWGELFGFFNKPEGKELEFITEEVSVFMVNKKRRVGEAAGERCRRDVIQAMVLVPAIDGFVTASRKGTICIWTNKLKLQASCELKVDFQEASWVTDVAYLTQLRRVIVCTERSVCVWDHRAKNKSQSIFYIKPLDYSPQCICWIPFTDRLMEDTVLFGDDHGYMNLMTLTPTDFATTSTQKQGAKQSSTPRPGDPGFMTIHPNKLQNKIVRRRLHRDRVVKVSYYPELRCFASCTPGSGYSFVLEEVERIIDGGLIRGMNVLKGVSAFTFSSKANIVATGGVDKIIRIWHPHIFTRPTGKLIGHLFTIVAIDCNESDQHLISLSAARVVRVWDLHTLTSLQVFTDNEERPGEKRIYAMIFDLKYQRLLTGSSVVDAWPMTRAVEDTMAVPQTHDRPLVQALYNSELNQVVTVCNESVIKVWESETGALVYSIPDPHGLSVDVTALALDATGYRMVSGGYDGSVKVFDFGAGHEIKKLPVTRTSTEGEHSIVDLKYCVTDQRYVLVLGWSNTLKILLDGNEGQHLMIVADFSDLIRVAQPVTRQSTTFSRHQPLPGINSRQNTIYTEDHMYSQHTFSSVACVVTSSDDVVTSLVVTGSQTGSLVFWIGEQASVRNVSALPELTEEEADNQVTDSDTPRAVNALLVLTHTTRKPDPEYIARLLGRAARETTQGSVPRHSRQLSKQASGIEKQDTEAAENAVPKDENDIEQTAPKEASVKPDPAKEMTDLDDDPESHLIVVKHDPIIASCHEDGMVRFWDLQGTLLREVLPLTRNQGTPLTAICADADANILVAGDAKGYCVKWNVGEFLENPYSEDVDLIKQEVYWHCHMTKVVTVAYLDSIKAVVTGSSDASARLWSSETGVFIGFFGQSRPFNLPDVNLRTKTPVLPFDITEGPLAPVKAVSAHQTIRASQRREYPLIFNEDLWTPFRRTDTQFIARSQKTKPEDAKFFEALIKPRQEKLESWTSGSVRTGAVFRALPVYRVSTPVSLSAPPSYLPTLIEDREHKPSLAASSKKRRVTAASRRSTAGRRSTGAGRASTNRSSSLSYYR